MSSLAETEEDFERGKFDLMQRFPEFASEIAKATLERADNNIFEAVALRGAIANKNAARSAWATDPRPLLNGEEETLENGKVVQDAEGTIITQEWNTAAETPQDEGSEQRLAMVSSEITKNKRCEESPLRDNDPRDVGSDVLGAPDIDQFAGQLLRSLPMKSGEDSFEIWRDTKGNLVAIPLTIGTPDPENFGGRAAKSNIQGTFVAVAHTHGSYTRRDARELSKAETRRQRREVTFDANTLNRDGRVSGPGDHCNIVDLGVPNYIRSSNGVDIMAVERRNNKITRPGEERIILRPQP